MTLSLPLFNCGDYIEQLARDGYLVWYDEGIDPGSEWPEIIARHLNNSTACIAFLSENALNSHNCRREINFALLKKKPFISVILEPVAMSLGMEMQLSATQAIFKYTLPSEPEFFEKLYSAPLLAPCFAAPDPSIIVSRSEDYTEGADGLFVADALNRGSFSDRWFVGDSQGKAGEKREEVRQEEKSAKPDAVSAEPQAALEAQEKVPAEKSLEPVKEPEEKPVMEPEAVFKVPVAPEPEKPPESENASEISSEEPGKEPEKASETPPSVVPWLVRIKSGEVIPLTEGTFKLGRSFSNSYVISGNSMVGRWHAMITVKGNECALIDNHSMNRTFLNQQALEPEEAYPLRDGDSIRIANERFVFYLRQMAETNPLNNHEAGRDG